MELQFTDSTTKIELPAGIFECDFNEALIHQAVTAFLSGGRAGTHAQKTRAEIRGGGIKPWRQKGTGRARAGTIRSPLWRKGGVIFAAKPRSYKQKVNKKAYRGAICSIMSELLRQDRLVAVEALTLENAKTKTLLKTLADLLKVDILKNSSTNQYLKVLIITETIDENLSLASRNLRSVEVRDSLNIDPVVLVNADKVLVTKAALKCIEGWLK